MMVARLLLMLLLSKALPVASAVGAALPTVVSTNLCADILALSLAEPAQLLSVSRKSQDPRVSSMPLQAQRFPANEGTAEEVIALRPDIVLASRRWQARYQRELFERHGIRVVVMPVPVTWDDIFTSTEALAAELGREAAGAALVAEVRARLKHLAAAPRPLSLLYLRPNGGSAGLDTQVDTVFRAVGVRNHAAEGGLRGWGRYSLEELVNDPPDIFVAGELLRDTAYANSTFIRHGSIGALMAARPVLRFSGNHWGCSNWQLIEAAEDIAAQIDHLDLPHMAGAAR